LSSSVRYLLITLTTAFLALTFIKSIYFTQKHGGTDLRSRTIGSRLLFTGHSPYFYKWTPADGEFLLDPNDNAKRLVNGNVATPAALYAMYPLSLLPYPTLRLVWTVLLFIAGLSAVFLVLKNAGPVLLTACIIVTGLICSDTWLVNIERGQVYILYTFLFALLYRLYISGWKFNQFASGFIGGLFILFRPFAGIIGLGFLLHGKWKWLAGCIAGFAFGCLLFVAPDPSLWKDYFKAMQHYNKEITGTAMQNAGAEEYTKPAIIEGANNLSLYSAFNVGQLYTVHDYLKMAGIGTGNREMIGCYILILALLSIFFFRLRNKNASPVTLFLFAYLAYILAELFFITPRTAYNVIQWIFPLCLIGLQARAHLPSLIMLVTGLLLLHNLPVIFPYQSALAELVFLGLTFYYIFFFPAVKNHNQESLSYNK
jgi:hypothetical protein